jgi:hypothetical protein
MPSLGLQQTAATYPCFVNHTLVTWVLRKLENYSLELILFSIVRTRSYTGIEIRGKRKFQAKYLVRCRPKSTYPDMYSSVHIQTA